MRKPWLIPVAVSAGALVLLVLIRPLSPSHVPASGAATARTASPSPGITLTGVIGTLETVAGNRLTVRDGEGDHTVLVRPDTVINRAIGAPGYALVHDHDISGLRPGDVLSVAGRSGADGSLTAVHISADVILGRFGTVTAVGPRFVDVRLNVSRLSQELEPTPTRLWIAPDTDIEKLNAAGRYIPARLDEVRPGQFVSLQAQRADDGSIVLVNLALDKDSPAGPG